MDKDLSIISSDKSPPHGEIARDRHAAPVNITDLATEPSDWTTHPINQSYFPHNKFGTVKNGEVTERRKGSRAG